MAFGFDVSLREKRIAGGQAWSELPSTSPIMPVESLGPAL